MSDPRIQGEIQDFFRRAATQPYLELLFDQLSDICFFVKNHQSHFITGNRVFFEKCGAHQVEEIYGKTDFDFFPRDLARQYVEDDEKVIARGVRIIGKVELVPNSDRSLDWYLTHKIPIFDHQGSVIGLAGITRDLSRGKSVPQPYLRWKSVIDHIQQHFEQNLQVRQLASLSHLSISQFERSFKATFHVTPIRYITQVRLSEASRLLRESTYSIAAIASRCGFYDHSYFTRQFNKCFGVTPKRYRRIDSPT